MNFSRNPYEHEHSDDVGDPLPRDAQGHTLTGDALVAQLCRLLEEALRRHERQADVSPGAQLAERRWSQR